MSHQGDFALESTFDLKFTSRNFSTGAPFALSGGTIAAYPDNSTTEVTAGITLTADFDARTGLNNVRVVATAVNGYLSGSNYALVLTAGTVNSVSVVGEVIGEFSIQARSGVRPTVAGRTLDVSVTGEAGVDWANVGSPTTALALTGTTISTTQKVDIETIKTNPVVNAGTITFPTTATLASTTNITAGTITTTTNLTNLPAITANWLTAAGIAAGALNGKGDWMLSYTQPTGFLAATFPAGTVANTTNITAGTITTTTNLTTNNDKTGYGLSAAAVQAIWDALTSALTTVGSIGKRLVDNLTGDIFARVGAPIGASISADIAGVQSDTDNIQTRIPAALVAGRMDANVGAIAANAITAASINAAALNGKGDWSTVAGIIAGVSEGALNLQGMLRVILAACAGKSNSHESGAPKYRDTADLKNRISATTDANGNRTSMVLDDT